MEVNLLLSGTLFDFYLEFYVIAQTRPGSKNESLLRQRKVQKVGSGFQESPSEHIPHVVKPAKGAYACKHKIKAGFV